MKKQKKAGNRPSLPRSRFWFAAMLALILGLMPGYARAQAAEEESIEEEAEDEEYYDEEDFSGSDVYENEVGLDDNYRLDSVTAETFQKMTSMERDNAIMKLQIEQERLKIDLEKQRAAKKKVETDMADDEIARGLKRQDQEKKLMEEKRKQAAEEEKFKAETDKRKREEAMSKAIMDKINKADFSNPEEISAITQLMAMAKGEHATQVNLPSKQKEPPFEEKYAIKSISGVSGNLVATLESKEKRTTSKVKAGNSVEGWVVESVKSSSILFRKDGQTKIMYLNQ